MCILALLLTGVTVAVCYIDWSTSYAQAQEALEISLSAAPHENGRMRIRGGIDAGELPDFEDYGSEGFGQGAAAGRGEGPSVDTPVASYVERNGTLMALPNSAGLLSSSMLDEAQAAVEDAPDGMGTLDDLGLVFLKEQRQGETYVAFADAAILDGWQSLAITMGLAEIAILALFFVVSILFSKWALRPVQEAWDKQRAFVSNASHELKTPLSIASANTAILLDEPGMPPEQREQWLSRSAVALDGMRVLINDMLDLASIDETGSSTSDTRKGNGIGETASCAGGVPTHGANLSRIVQGAVLQFESVAYERGFELTEDVTDNIFVTGDPVKIERVVNILLDNACKYVDDGGRITVSVRGSVGEGADGNRGARLSVSNTGSYIPPDKIDAIFDRFYRADEARSRGEGYGLGLSIARGIADEIGATLEVESVQDAAGAARTSFTLLFGE